MVLILLSLNQVEVHYQQCYFWQPLFESIYASVNNNVRANEVQVKVRVNKVQSMYGSI